MAFFPPPSPVAAVPQKQVEAKFRKGVEGHEKLLQEVSGQLDYQALFDVSRFVHSKRYKRIQRYGFHSRISIHCMDHICLSMTCYGL